jgi:hypothetical protein
MSEQSTTKPAEEVISPEGVEERLVCEIAFRITLTGGGKHRVYMRSIVQGQPEPAEWETVSSTQAEAELFMARAMTVCGMSKALPDVLSDAIKGVLGKKGDA